ncbi:MAG: chromate transporter [Bryobacteraceae bacterium]|nr:chromate transporter [Bryobacteraceae bacterium]MDW8377352.1 chromate transporter [Bryobacterales bacterium]
MSKTEAPESRPSFWSIFLIFLKAGNLTFGGGDPTMAILQREFCERRHWLTAEQYSLAYSLARVTPGTNVLAFCVAVARMMHGALAAVASVIAASGPSAVLVVWLTVFYQNSSGNPVAMLAVSAVLSAVVGMMLAAAVSLLRPHVKAGKWQRAAVFCASTIILREGFNLSPVQILALAVLGGALWKERA